ncbi:MAG: hypothetical protein LBR10_03375, partial [Prevotellaceae bacterium]|nr:hypothetical protein [Prevotellaceae bacterium]
NPRERGGEKDLALFLFFCTVKKIIYLCIIKIKNKVMAVISMFYGIIISMYFRDNRRHPLK